MKIKIEAIVYKLLYEKLHDKFFKDFVSDAEDKDSRDGWDSDYPGKKKKIANDLFQLKSPHYFLRKNEEHAKQHIEVGYPLYPMTVDREQMVLALKYLLLGKDFELIGDFPDFTIKKYQEWDWKEKYDELLKLFIAQYFPNGLNKANNAVIQDDKANNDELEKYFLQVITGKPEIIESETIKKVILDFFSHLSSKSSKRYIHAWHKLTPQFQKYSLWDGYLSSFEKSLACVKRVQCEKMEDFGYSYKRVRVSVTYTETGTLLNLPEFIKHRKSSNGVEKVSFQFLIEGIDNWNANFNTEQSEKLWRLNRIKRYNKPLLSMTNDELMDVEFQKQVFLHFVNDDSIFKGFCSEEYSKTYEKSEFILMFKHDEWMIDAILPQ